MYAFKGNELLGDMSVLAGKWLKVGIAAWDHISGVTIHPRSQYKGESSSILVYK